MKGTPRETAKACLQQLCRVLVASLLQTVLLLSSRTNRTATSVMSTLSQIAVFYTFATVLLTWAHLHHFGAQGIKSSLMRKQVLALCVGVGVLSSCGFISIEATQGRELALATTQGFGIVQALLSTTLAVCFLFYGRKVFESMKLVEKHNSQTAPKTKNAKDQGVKNSRFTWRLAQTLSLLFIIQSFLSALTVFKTDSTNFGDYVVLSEMATLCLFVSMYCVYHPKVVRLRQTASSKPSAASEGTKASRCSLRQLRGTHKSKASNSNLSKVAKPRSRWSAIASPDQTFQSSLCAVPEPNSPVDRSATQARSRSVAPKLPRRAVPDLELTSAVAGSEHQEEPPKKRSFRNKFFKRVQSLPAVPRVPRRNTSELARQQKTFENQTSMPLDEF